MENDVLDGQLETSQSTGTYDFTDRAESALTDGFELDVMGAVKRGWELFKKDGGPGVGYMALVQIGGFIVSLIPIIGSFINLGLALCNRAISVGYAIYGQKIEKDEAREFGDYFKGFTNIGPFILSGLIIGLFKVALLIIPVIMMVTAIISSDLIGNPDPDPMAILAILLPLMGTFFLFMIPVMLIQLTYSWTGYHIWFGKLDFWPAMEYSRKIVFKRFGSFIYLAILCFLINLLGTMCFILGLFVTIPVTYLIMYAAFEQVIGTPGNGDELK